jgi:adenosylcobinamide-GDP ribazoletransferase
MIGIAQGATPPRLRAELRAAVAAVCFLTRLPLGRWIRVDGEDVVRAGAFFPLIGAGVGAAVGGVAYGLVHVLSGWLAAVLALAVGTALTGALHLDALADTADALGASSRQRALEIMRDHAIGSYGATALALDLLLKAGALSTLAVLGHVLRVAVVAGALSRTAPVLLAAVLPYARTERGFGSPLTRGSRSRATIATLLAVGIAVPLAGADGAIAAAAAAAITVVLGLCYRRWLGGVTGDTLGAAVEVTEVAVFLLGVGLLGAR